MKPIQNYIYIDSWMYILTWSRAHNGPPCKPVRGRIGHPIRARRIRRLIK